MAYDDDDDEPKLGRPCRADGPTVTTSIRLTEAELWALMTHAAKEDEPRGVIIREALKRAGLFRPVRGYRRVDITVRRRVRRRAG